MDEEICLTLVLLFEAWQRLVRARVRYVIRPGLDALVVFIAMGSLASRWGAR